MQTITATRKQAQKNSNKATQQAMLQVLNAYVANNKVIATKQKHAKRTIYKAAKNYVLCYVSSAFVANINFASNYSVSYTVTLANNANLTQMQINNAYIKCVTKKTFNKYVKQVQNSTVN
jgi:hypothetical protein